MDCTSANGVVVSDVVGLGTVGRDTDDLYRREGQKLFVFMW